MYASSTFSLAKIHAALFFTLQHVCISWVVKSYKGLILGLFVLYFEENLLLFNETTNTAAYYAHCGVGCLGVLNIIKNLLGELQ